MKGRSQFRTRGYTMGRLVVATATKASRVPHAPAFWAPLSWLSLSWLLPESAFSQLH
jgi:hypothetical protein